MSKPQDCIFFTGVAGGVQVDVADGALALRHAEIVRKLSERGPDSDDADAPWVRAARLIANSWTSRIEAAKEHRRILVPGELHELEILRLSKTSKLMCFGCGAIFEIWNLEEWRAAQRTMAADRQDILADAQRDLQLRDTEIVAPIDQGETGR